MKSLPTPPFEASFPSPPWSRSQRKRRRLTLPQAQLALSALQALSGPGAVGGGHALVAICDTGISDVVGVLYAWLEAHD
jgi:hypothetical protein